MLTLIDAARELEAARGGGDPARLARALLAWAERAPVFRYRGEPVRLALVEAARLLRPLGDAGLEARCLLRLGEVQMLMGALDQAAELLDQARARCERAGDAECALRAGCELVRVARRRGEAKRADAMLAEMSLDAERFTRHAAASGSFIAFTLAMAEGQLERIEEDAIATLRTLLNALDGEHVEAFDARFAAHQGIALVAQLNRRPEVALTHLRAVTTLVKGHDAPLDLLECRLALATNLAAQKQSQEARRLLQQVVDDARDLDAEEHQLLGLTSLATVLADLGSVKVAVDRAIESAAGYAKRGDILGYVHGATLAAHILLSHEKSAAAVEMLMYGVSALRRTVGEEAAQLLQAQIDAIQEELGEEKFEALCRQILDARSARKRL